MQIERVEVRLLDLPLIEPFVAAHGTVRSRQLTVIRVETDLGPGWGECSALPEPTYTNETAAGAFQTISELLAPQLLGWEAAPTECELVLPTSVRSVAEANPMATAGIEMALLDAELRAAGTSCAAWLEAQAEAPTKADSVPAGAAVGLAPPSDVAERAQQLAADGFGRVKLKITPGHDLTPVLAVARAVPDLEIQVDGNGSYRPEHLKILTRLAGSGVTAIEQPFAPDQVDAAVELVNASPVPIVADEAATDLETVQGLHARGALSGVSIKPARLGGLVAARQLHDYCLGHGLAATAGGMVESGLGRHALTALAALPGFAVTGDVSPARRWLAVDPWPDLTTTADRRVMVPTGPGIAPPPDLALLDESTIDRSDIG